MSSVVIALICLQWSLLCVAKKRLEETGFYMGSDSDMPTMKEALKVLKKFSINYELRVISAHRWPDEAVRYAKGLAKKGIKVLIAGAGGAAHLAGVIASHTTIPVIGVPMETKSLKGIDSLFSTVQMPGGVPVATVSIGRSGAKNAGVLACQILGLNDAGLSRELDSFKKKLAGSVRKKDKGVRRR